MILSYGEGHGHGHGKGERGLGCGNGRAKRMLLVCIICICPWVAWNAITARSLVTWRQLLGQQIREKKEQTNLQQKRKASSKCCLRILIIWSRYEDHAWYEAGVNP